MGKGVKWEGVEKLQVKLKKNANLKEVKEIVKLNGDELNKRMKRKTTSAFTKGYTTGTTARSINTELSDGGLTASVGPTTDYALYVEYGTRFMTAEPFVRPSLETQKKLFLKDMKGLIEE